MICALVLPPQPTGAFCQSHATVKEKIEYAKVFSRNQQYNSAKWKMIAKIKAMIYKTLHRKLNFEQH